jgi:Spy/CpxP family protein refolding chaperone
MEKMTMYRKWIQNTLLMLGMGLASAALFAQQTGQTAAAPAPEISAQSATTTADGKLNLSPEQKKQMREMRMSARDQAAIIRHDSKLTSEEKFAKLHELRAATREKMKAILTPEQQQAWATRREAHRAEMAAKLGLTDEQQGKLKDLFKSTREQRKSVLNSTTLTNDQKLAQLKQIRETTKTQLSTILTPDQMQKFREMRKGHRHGHKG